MIYSSDISKYISLPAESLNCIDKLDPSFKNKSPSTSLIDNVKKCLPKVKTSGKFYPHIESQDGSTDLTEYIVERTANLVGSGGYGFFYFESDHSPNSTQVITETKSGTALQIGSSDGQISFQFIETQPDSQNFDPGEDEVSPR